MQALVSESENPVIRPVWLVGASFGRTADQTPRFLREGRWENGYFDRYIEDVKSVLLGDRIAIKASYVRWQNLPFDNRGHPVSVMGIKATGTVTENAGDGRNLKVDWTPVDPPREWFFYTYRGTVWRVLPGRWATDGLISFVFEGEEQDIDAFRNDDYWKDRFGDQQESDPRFAWTNFYSEFADRLLAYRNDRRSLVAAIQEISSTPPQPHPPAGPLPRRYFWSLRGHLPVHHLRPLQPGDHRRKQKEDSGQAGGVPGRKGACSRLLRGDPHAE